MAFDVRDRSGEGVGGKDPVARRQRWRRPLAPPVSAPGWFGATALLAASLTPSLYPRPWLVQGVLSGVSLAVGYGLGGAVTRLARWAGDPVARAWQRLVGWRQGPEAVGGAARTTAAWRPRAAAVAAGVLAALAWNAHWQTDARSLLGLDQGVGAVAGHLVATALVAVATGYVLVLVGRALRWLRGGYARLLARVLGTRWAHRVRVVVAVLVAGFVISGVPLGWTMTALGGALVAADARVDPDVARPATTDRAGGPGSLVPWDTLSAPGRAFVAQGPTVDELEAFAGGPAKQPIRVYAGVASARTDRERARLAVAELDRMGAFERAVVVVVTPTGSGSVNPFAIDALEYLHAGDTAAVAMQYGHLPSWVTMAGNQERARQAARALFEAVAARVEQQPVGRTPKLLVYGESLGSFGSEANFTDLDGARARTDGMLLVGPTRGNRLWRDLTANRDEGSPVWQPVYQAGEHVRFGWDGASLLEPGGRWEPPRVAYLQHPTDPVTWLNAGVLVQRPEWLQPPRGPDISQAVPYIPLVTALQVIIDSALAETAPLGHGHMFGPEQAEAWALVAPPEGWRPERTRDLVRHLSARSDR